ncbi:MAG TPA: hypothetical protein VK559_00995 [Ferruginibacter sp.]|nr:hypothetical protein [Ferruginibacter sp.]
MTWLLFTLYLLIFCWLVANNRFMLNSGITPKILIALFLLKVMIGIANGWLMLHYFNGGDTWEYHNQALNEYHLLFTDPKEYVLNIFRSGYQTGYAGLFSSVNSYWNDLKINLIIKLLSIFDIFSGGNYYTNVIFFNFIVLFGNLALYKVFAAIYKGKENLVLIGCFLLPSFLLFTSAIHKEGLILLALGIALYYIYTSLDKKRIHVADITVVFICLVYIFLQRNFVLIALVPALIAWIWVSAKQYAPLKIFLVVYGIGAIVFFTAGIVSPSLDLPNYVAQKQASFLTINNAHSSISIDTLYPNFTSFIHNAPQAFIHATMRPDILDGKKVVFLYPFAIEFILYQLLLILFIFVRVQKPVLSINARSFILFGFFFSFSLIMIIGYTIPITGAIIRYRSIYLPFILTPVLCTINWERIKSHKH